MKIHFTSCFYILINVLSNNDVFDEKFYLKLGCREQNGKGFQILTYKDPYCSERANVYNNYYDTSSLQMTFDYCKRCEFSWYHHYNNDYDGGEYNYNYNNQNWGGGYYYKNMNKGNEMFPMHPSPLCSAMYAYRENCGYGCRRKSNQATHTKYGQVTSSNNMFTGLLERGDGYSGFEVFLLWTLSLSGKYN